MLSYDDLTGRIIDLRQTRDQTHFEAGDLCWYALEKMDIPAGTLAADTGYSAQHIRDLARTAKAFHAADDRRPREYVQWSHYKIAARTNDPHGWICRAEENGWSTRELQRRITGDRAEDPLEAAQRAFARVEKVIAAGGEGAEWIIGQLERLLSQRGGRNGPGPGSPGRPETIASCAGQPGG